MKGTLRILPIVCFILLLTACSSTKYVGDGEYLLDKVVIETENKQYKPSDLKPYLRQQPNFKVFGLMKWQLHLYSLSGKDEKKWINKRLRKMGQPPVILDTLLIRQSTEELERFMVNKGYIHADATASIDTSHRKKATVTYSLQMGEPYRIQNYAMTLKDPKIDSIAHLQAPHRSRLAAAFRSTPEEFIPLIKNNHLFDRDILDKERQRITTLLRRRGYYAFNRDNLAYQADTTVNPFAVDLEMFLKPYRQALPNGTVVDRPHRQYYIKDVVVVTDYDPLVLEERDTNFVLTDTTQAGDIYILYGQNGKSIRPEVLRKSTYITPGQLFNERNIEQTYASYASLRALRNVNIRFEELEENDTLKLNCMILTTPAKLQGFGVELEGTNSAGDLGFASSLNYQHRNLFKGSEVFSAKVRGAYEWLVGNKKESGLKNYWELGAETSVTFPRFLFPFLSYDSRRKLRATTELKVGYNWQTRAEYDRAILSAGWSYIWQERNNSLARHVFKLLDVNYVYLPRIDGEFLASIPLTTLFYNYRDQFIVGSGYTYSFKNYNPQNRQRNTHSLRVSYEMAGNLLYAFSKLTNAQKKEDNAYELFNINYAQYVKVDVDFSKSLVLDNRNTLAFHIGVGVGVPYGNSKYMPFERSYFSGGANSVRGWSVRTLGPGGMPGNDSILFIDQAGDIRLDLNLEYRTKIFWKFELAAYIDAGNIWTLRPFEEQKNGNFDFSRFYREIAISYGLGIRLDFDFFLIRFDTGMKAYDPQEKGSKRWAITNPNFRGNFAWHFAVGYPF